MDVRWESRGSSGRANEDYVWTAPGLALMLDGAGMPPDVETGCVHGVRWYVRRLAHHLGAAASGDVSLASALADAIGATAGDHRTTCDVGHPRSPSSTIVIARWDEVRLDWLVLGDSTLLVFDSAGMRAVCDRRLDGVARVERERAAPGADCGVGARTARRRLVDRERERRNRNGGYWIAADDPSAAAHALRGQRGLSGLRAVFLASDGATRPVDRFHERTWDDLAATVTRDGPRVWLDIVRELEASDRDAVRWPRSKVSDDATVVALYP